MGTVYKTLAERTVNDAPAYFAARLVIEDCENIHLHFRNMRLEFNKGEFIQFAEAMTEARQNLGPCVVELLPLDSIDSWDEVHQPADNPYGFNADPQDLHTARVDEVKLAINDGKRIRPILVAPIGEGRYKRKDGFCRYMAYKLLGKETVECIIVPGAPAGGQDKKSFLISDIEYEQIKAGKTF